MCDKSYKKTSHCIILIAGLTHCGQVTLHGIIHASQNQCQVWTSVFQKVKHECVRKIFFLGYPENSGRPDMQAKWLGAEQQCPFCFSNWISRITSQILCRTASDIYHKNTLVICKVSHTFHGPLNTWKYMQVRFNVASIHCSTLAPQHMAIHHRLFSRPRFLSWIMTQANLDGCKWLVING